MNISRYKKVLSKYATGITVVTKKNKNIVPASLYGNGRCGESAFELA